MASCTLFSPKCMWPLSINGFILSIANVFETAIIFGEFLFSKLLISSLISFLYYSNFEL